MILWKFDYFFRVFDVVLNLVKSLGLMMILVDHFGDGVNVFVSYHIYLFFFCYTYHQSWLKSDGSQPTRFPCEVHIRL